jgi:putative transposase
MERDPAVRLCVTCGKLKSADQFAPRRRKCVACRTLPDAAQARARDQALRHLGLEHLNAYRELYRAKRREISDTVPAARARKQAVSRTLRTLEQQYRPRYVELYQEELERARSQRQPRRPGRPAGSPDRLTIGPDAASTWRRDGAGGRQLPQREQWARRRADQEAVRERAVTLFRAGRSAATVAEELGVARWTATEWRARWQSGGSAALRNRRLGRQPTVPDSRLPAIERALEQGAKAHGFDSDRWTASRVAVVIQGITGVQPGRKAVHRLLRDRLGWTFQPVASDTAVVTVGPRPQPPPASASDSLAAVADAALADLEDLPAGTPELGRSNRPASPAERRDATPKPGGTNPESPTPPWPSGSG